MLLGLQCFFVFCFFRGAGGWGSWEFGGGGRAREFRVFRMGFRVSCLSLVVLAVRSGLRFRPEVLSQKDSGGLLEGLESCAFIGGLGEEKCGV